jgi:hypothetical protein
MKKPLLFFSKKKKISLNSFLHNNNIFYYKHFSGIRLCLWIVCHFHFKEDNDKFHININILKNTLIWNNLWKGSFITINPHQKYSKKCKKINKFLEESLWKFEYALRPFFHPLAINKKYFILFFIKNVMNTKLPTG